MDRTKALIHNVSVLKGVAERGIAKRIERARAKGRTHIGWACGLTELSVLSAYKLGVDEILVQLQNQGYKAQIETSFHNQKAVKYIHVSWA